MATGRHGRGPAPLAGSLDRRSVLHGGTGRGILAGRRETREQNAPCGTRTRRSGMTDRAGSERRTSDLEGQEQGRSARMAMKRFAIGLLAMAAMAVLTGCGEDGLYSLSLVTDGTHVVREGEALRGALVVTGGEVTLEEGSWVPHDT